MAPPAEWPVMRREEALREGFSWRRERRREETGASMRRAVVRKPEWQRLPGSSWGGVSWGDGCGWGVVEGRLGVGELDWEE